MLQVSGMTERGRQGQEGTPFTRRRAVGSAICPVLFSSPTRQFLQGHQEAGHDRFPGSDSRPKALGLRGQKTAALLSSPLDERGAFFQAGFWPKKKKNLKLDEESAPALR